MRRIGGISAEWQPPWWWVAALALAAAVGLLAWEPVVYGTPRLSWHEVDLSLILLLVSGVAALGGLQARSEARRRELANALRRARARLQCVDEVLDAWQFRTDAAHRVVELRPPNRAEPSEWRSATSALLWDVFPAEGDAALPDRMAAGAPLEAVAVQRATDAGSRLPGVLRARPYHDEFGAFAGYHGMVREAEVPVLQPAQGTPAVLAPADALGAEQESFGYTVSHDLRAPIRVVEGFTKIVKEDYGRLLDRVGNDHLDRVLGAAARMNNMIDALLALSRLASQPLARQPVNLSQLAVYIADDLRRQAPDRPVQLTIEPGIQLQGDPTLLRVVLENLLGNAWKYTAKCPEPQVVLERHPGAIDTYTVRDNGAGFDMRFADRLFGVFQRLHSANDFPGTGIGLASVRRIVRRHGGDIWGEAEVNRGAKFHFSLPQTALPQAPQVAAAPAQHPSPDLAAPPWAPSPRTPGAATTPTRAPPPRPPASTPDDAPLARTGLPLAAQPAREAPSRASSSRSA